MIQAAERIVITWSQHMVGAAIARQLMRLGHPRRHILIPDTPDSRSPADLASFFEHERPDQVYLVAATLHQPESTHDAMADRIAHGWTQDLNAIEAAFRAGVKKLMYVCDARCYPPAAIPPIAEEGMGSGLHDRQHGQTGLSQFKGLRLCEAITRQYGAQLGMDYRSAILCQVYGPGDRYDSAPACAVAPSPVASLIAQVHWAQAKGQTSLTLAASQAQTVELLFVDDAAEALVHAMELPRRALDGVVHNEFAHLNIGASRDIGMAELAQRVAEVLGYHGQLRLSTPAAATPARRVLGSQRIQSLGWQPFMALGYGLELACMDFHVHHAPRLDLSAEPPCTRLHTLT